MSRVRELIKQADPEVTEEIKWRKLSNPAGIPVWYHDGMICTGETYKNHLRLTFLNGSILKSYDPKGLFNTSRAIVIHKEDKIDEVAFKDIIRAALALNRKSKVSKKSRK